MALAHTWANWRKYINWEGGDNFAIPGFGTIPEAHYMDADLINKHDFYSIWNALQETGSEPFYYQDIAVGKDLENLLDAVNTILVWFGENPATVAYKQWVRTDPIFVYGEHWLGSDPLEESPWFSQALIWNSNKTTFKAVIDYCRGLVGLDPFVWRYCIGDYHLDSIRLRQMVELKFAIGRLARWYREDGWFYVEASETKGQKINRMTGGLPPTILEPTLLFDAFGDAYYALPDPVETVTTDPGSGIDRPDLYTGTFFEYDYHYDETDNRTPHSTTADYEQEAGLSYFGYSDSLQWTDTVEYEDQTGNYDYPLYNVEGQAGLVQINVEHDGETLESDPPIMTSMATVQVIAWLSVSLKVWRTVSGTLELYIQEDRVLIPGGTPDVEGGGYMSGDILINKSFTIMVERVSGTWTPVTETVLSDWKYKKFIKDYGLAPTEWLPEEPWVFGYVQDAVDYRDAVLAKKAEWESELEGMLATESAKPTYTRHEYKSECKFQYTESLTAEVTVPPEGGYVDAINYIGWEEMPTGLTVNDFVPNTDVIGWNWNVEHVEGA